MITGKDFRLDFNQVYIVQNARVVDLMEMRPVDDEPPYGLKAKFDNGAEIQCMYDDSYVVISVDNATATASRA